MLIVAEKFRMAEVLAKVLGFNKYRYPFFENEDGDVICYSSGHLFEVCHHQDDLYNWRKPQNFNHLPRALTLKPTKDYELKIKGRSLMTSYLRENIPLLMKEHDTIINACDADREGECIFYDLFNVANTQATIYRLDLSKGITRSRIQKAYDNLLCGTQTKARAYASQARCFGDFGYALLTVVTTFYGRKSLLHPLLGGYTDKKQSVVSIGRVIIPLLKLIGDRCQLVEKAQSKHVHIPFVDGSFQVGKKTVDVTFKYDYERLGFKPSLLANAQLVERYIKTKSKSHRFVIAEVEHVSGIQSAPELHDTASIQAEMSDKSPLETLDILQSLYEKGLITYPRTDETSVPDDEVSSSNLKALFDGMNTNFNSVSESTTKSSRSFLEKQDSLIEQASESSSKAEINASHTALTPTDAKVDLGNLSSDELSVYTKICERFTDSLSGDKHICSVNIIGGFVGDTTGMLGEVSPSFTLHKIVKTNADGESSNRFMHLKQGDELSITDIRVEHEELPLPQYYCESELPMVMKNISETVDDPKMKSLLIRAKGLGSASTRHNGLPSLLKRNYVEVTNIGGRRCCVITSKGEALLSILPDAFTSPITTALWELKFIEIEESNDLDSARALRDAFIRSTYQHLESYIQNLNRQYATGGGIENQCSTPPDKQLLAKVKQRARALALEIPVSILKSKSSCLSWLDRNPELIHSRVQTKLEDSGLHMANDVQRDARRVALRAQGLKEDNQNPPTNKALLKASMLAQKTGCKMPKQAKLSAIKCSEFIQHAQSKLKPSDDEVRALKKLASKANVIIGKDILNSRLETRRKTQQLRKALGK
ncbi:DNA topoisomerase [Vibrio sp. R78045]|uniref:DNA topoisomerase n=1 Tax=Vibrio sp. R78045 TaxID=3093868 RepID=UPI0036F443C8